MSVPPPLSSLPSPSLVATIRRRAKRRRYTAVACDGCRRRKVKCLPSDAGDGRLCQRCANRGLEHCGFQEAYPQPEGDADADGDDNGHSDDDARHSPATTASVMALRQELNTLRDTLTGWMAASAPSSTLTVSVPLPAPAPPPAPAPALPTPSATVSASASASASAPDPDLSPTSRMTVAREEARFVGPTRPAYSFQAGGQALSRLGFSSLDTDPAQASAPQTPTPTLPGSPAQGSPAAADQPEPARGEPFWASCDRAQLEHWIAIFEEEIQSVYPCVVSQDFVRNADDILRLARVMSVSGFTSSSLAKLGESSIHAKDVHLATLAVATAMVLEAHGQNGPNVHRELGSAAVALVGPVERHVLNILEPSRELKDLQLLILLSIYYFHTDQDLLAWRTIGLAAREALVMGLHRKTTLFDTFRDPGERAMAVRVFWTIYVLDRRWSFGAGLSFALVDHDIDPDLPEPSAFPDQDAQGHASAYLQCMVSYGRLSSTLWSALHLGGGASQQQQHQQSVTRCRDRAEATTLALDRHAQEWLECIPSELRLRHLRLGLVAAAGQPPALERLRALLYLRGNHIRVLIYRHYLLSPARIRSSHRGAWLAVDIACDSITVLVHLDESSSQIYRRQQAAFNYFLVSALAVLFLAVCNAPETFAGACKQSIVRAVGLLRKLSRFSYGSRRLWRSVRGVLPLLRKLEARRAADGGGGDGNSGSSSRSGREQQSGDAIHQQNRPKETERQQQREQQDGHVRGELSGGHARQSMVRHDGETTAGGNGGGSGGLTSSIIYSSTGTPPQQQQQQQPPPLEYGHHMQSLDTPPDFNAMGNGLMDLFLMFESGQPFHTVSQQQQQQQQQAQDLPTHLDAMSWLGDGTDESLEYTSAEQGAFSSQFNLLI